MGIFKDSAKSLDDFRTLATTGLLIAMAIALRAAAIQLTPDVRITFQFLPICVIAMLYGPVVSMMGALATDLIGFMFNATGFPYSIQLGVSVAIGGLIYGIFLYRKNTSEYICLYGAIARIAVVLICNIALNSYFMFTLFTNPQVDVFTADGFPIFITTSMPRIAKSLIMLPIDIALICIVLPIAYKAYQRFFGGKRK